MEANEIEVTYDFSFLEGWIKQKFKNRTNFANFLGISATSLGNKLRNKTHFSTDEILLVKENFNLNDEETCKLFLSGKVSQRELK